jgi:CubicO group peptidase (beta-lactamase class C family)
MPTSTSVPSISWRIYESMSLFLARSPSARSPAASGRTLPIRLTSSSVTLPPTRILPRLRLLRLVLLALTLFALVLLALVLIALVQRPMVQAPDAPSATLAAHVAAWPGMAAAGIVVCDRSGDQPHTAVVATAGLLTERFEWASVTKLLVCLASLVALEEGSVTLADPAGPPGSTLAHLLAHASGLPFQGDQPIARPATNRIYSNTGIEIAAAHLEARTAMSFRDYLSSGVLEPLGMRNTLLKGSPAHGASGPLEDLLLIASEMLAPSLVSPETMQLATTVAWPGLGGVLPGFGRQAPCDWGLGPEIRGHKTPHWTGQSNSPATFGHFGQSGSVLWVDPSADLALVGLCSTPFGPWAKEAWPALSDAVLAWAGVLDRPAVGVERCRMYGDGPV